MEEGATPRSGRTKKKSALSRLAQRQKQDDDRPRGESISPPPQPKPRRIVPISEDSDEGIELTRSSPTIAEHHHYKASNGVAKLPHDDALCPSSSSSEEPRIRSTISRPLRVLTNSDTDSDSVEESAPSLDLHKRLEQRYRELEDSDEYDQPHPLQSFHGPPQSKHSPQRVTQRDISSSTTSSLFMSMAHKQHPGQLDVISQQSLQSTSVLPMISTKEARNRSFLLGSINSNGSLLGSDELKRFFPEKKMRIFVGTWNMCELKTVSDSVNDFLLPETSDYVHDAYVIGSQESTPNREEWEISLQETLGPQHVLFHSAAFGVLYLNIFIRRDLIWYCSVCEEASITTRTGPSGVKTKGGLGVSFTLFGTSFLFVNSHLTAHDGKARERAADFRKICSGLSLPKNNIQTTASTDDDITSHYDCVFWMGDLNFRLVKERDHVDETVKGIEKLEIPSYDDLMQYDELFRLQNDGLAFEKFSEGRIKFKPSYKYDVGTNNYDTTKLRIPSYTDRILYRAKQKGQISCLHYDSAQEVLLSDHKPVYAMFEVDLRPGRDNIPLSGGQFKKQVWLAGNKRRANKLQSKKLSSQKSSKICSVQ